jgi:hypothetical protein
LDKVVRDSLFDLSSALSLTWFYPCTGPMTAGEATGRTLRAAAIAWLERFESSEPSRCFHFTRRGAAERRHFACCKFNLSSLARMPSSLIAGSQPQAAKAAASFF